jgi:hypothetical protein
MSLRLDETFVWNCPNPPNNQKLPALSLQLAAGYRAQGRLPAAGVPRVPHVPGRAAVLDPPAPGPFAVAELPQVVEEVDTRTNRSCAPTLTLSPCKVIPASLPWSPPQQLTPPCLSNENWPTRLSLTGRKRRLTQPCIAAKIELMKFRLDSMALDACCCALRLSCA